MKSIYGKPNGVASDKTRLIDVINEKVIRDNHENVYILGDFNFVTSTLDRNSNKLTANDETYRHKWSILEGNVGKGDSFRINSKNRRLYTFSSTTNSKSRIDRIYVPVETRGRVEAVNYEHTEWSDHKLVRTRLASYTQKGPGQYIFNNSLLNDDIFVAEIRNIILEFRSEKENFSSWRIMWDFLKMGVASHARNYSTQKARKEKIDLSIIE